MDHIWSRIADQLIDRVTGPMKFRLVLQPLMASILAIRGGIADAKAGRRPYFWDLCTGSGQRMAIVKEGWKSIGKVFILAVVLDVVYQLIVTRPHYAVRPGEALVVAVILALLPYLILRGLTTRAVAHKYEHRASSKTAK
jgi:hypothetical protein